MTALRLLWSRGGIGRAALSSLLATGSDFVAFVMLVSLGVVPAVATLMGCLIGAMVNFSVNRYWAFEGQGNVTVAMLRYAVVSGASAMINAMLVEAATSAMHLRAVPAWLLARTVVFVCLTYPLFRTWVFGTRRGLEEAAPAAAPAATRGISWL